MKIKSIEYSFFGKNDIDHGINDVLTKTKNNRNYRLRECVIQRLFEMLLCSEYDKCDDIRKQFIQVVLSSNELNPLDNYCFVRENWLGMESRPDFLLKNDKGLIVAAIELKWDDNKIEKIANQIDRYLSHNDVNVVLITKGIRKDINYHSEDPRYKHICYEDILPWLNKSISIFNCIEDENSRHNILSHAYSLCSLICPPTSIGETRKKKMGRVIRSAFEIARQRLPELLLEHPDWKSMCVPNTKEEFNFFDAADRVVLPIVRKRSAGIYYLYGFVNYNGFLMIALKGIKSSTSFSVVTIKQLKELKGDLKGLKFPVLDNPERGFVITVPIKKSNPFSLFGNEKLKNKWWMNMASEKLAEELINAYKKYLNLIDKALAELKI